MMANYHAALAGGGSMAEWPMPDYPLRNSMMEEEWHIENGLLHLPETPGLGLRLADDIEQKYPFREESVYSCLTDASIIPPDEIWT